MKKHKNIIGLLLFVLLMLISAVSSADYWTAYGNYDISWYNSTDTSFEIETEKQLAGLAYLVNNSRDYFSGKTITITKSLDLSGHTWRPIGDNPFSRPFRGTMVASDGVIISNIYSAESYSGFFGGLNGATIKNLSLTGIINKHPTYTTAYTGALCAYADNSTIENVVTNCTVYSNYFVGGIIGSARNCTIKGCTSNGSVEAYRESKIAPSGANSFAGGIVGLSTGNTIITGCTNNSTVDASEKAGGIVGNAVGASSINKCNNTGNITANRSASSSIEFYAGGIAGYSTGNGISESTNSGIVIANNYAGGIAAYAANGNIIGSDNSGNVSSSLVAGTAGGIVAQSNQIAIVQCNQSDSDIEAFRAGGIAGLHTGIAEATITENEETITINAGISRCEVTGTTVTGAYSGSITGEQNDSIVTANSATSSNVKKHPTYTDTWVGGLSGKSSRSVISGNTINIDNSIEGKYAGGLVGYFEGDYNRIVSERSEDADEDPSDNWTYPSISGTYAGGLFGYQIGSLNLSNYTNDKDITGLYRAGGVVGYIDGNRGTVTLTDCHNKGNIISEGTTQDFLGINDGYFGGLVSRIDNVTEVTVSSSSNTGNLQNASTTTRPIYAGGLIGGIIPTQDTATITFAECTNSVDVDAKYHAGGIIGHIGKPDETKTWMYANFIQCENTGNVTGDTYAGGISGYLSYTVDDLRKGHVGLIGYEGIYSVFQDCKNSGDVKSEIAGGIASEVCAGKMEHCLNTGDVTSIMVSSTYDNIYAGGLIGVNDRGLIINSANYGDVSGGNEANGAGGLVGYNFTSIVANNYTKAPVSNAAYVGGILGVYGKDYEQYLNGYADMTNSYSSGDLSGGSVKVAGLTSVWHEYFKRSYWLKSTAKNGLGQYDGKVYQNPEYTKGGFFEDIVTPVQLVTFDDRFNNVDEGSNGMTILQTLEYETQNYNSSSPEIPYLHWVQPQSAPSPYGSAYNGNYYPVFGYPITFVIYTDGEISSVGGSLDSTDATQIEDFFNGGYLADYYGAYGDAVTYTAKANKGYAFEKSESDDVTLTRDATDITNSFTMHALNTDEGPVVINLYFVSQYTAQITKIWDDADNEDRIRPKELSVSLALNNAVIQDINEKNVEEIISADENGYWQSEIYTLPKNDNYANLEIWEGHIDGYTVEKRSVTIEGHDIYAVIINRHEPTPKVIFTATNESMVDIDYKVTKTWNDDDSLTTIKHPDILIQLYQGEEPELRLVAEQTLRSGAESVTFTDMPKYVDNDSETLVKYTIKEVINDDKWVNIGNVWYNMDGLGTYTATVTNATITTDTAHDSEVAGRIVNKYDLLQKTIDVVITKIWNDHQNENKVRPESIRLGLFRYSTDVTPYAEITLSRESDDVDNNAASWTGKFEDLPLYEGTSFIDYTKFVIKEWDPATSQWIFYGDSMIVTSDDQDYTYTYKKVTE